MSWGLAGCFHNVTTTQHLKLLLKRGPCVRENGPNTHSSSAGPSRVAGACVAFCTCLHAGSGRTVVKGGLRRRRPVGRAAMLALFSSSFSSSEPYPASDTLVTTIPQVQVPPSYRQIFLTILPKQVLFPTPRHYSQLVFHIISHTCACLLLKECSVTPWGL